MSTSQNETPPLVVWLARTVILFFFRLVYKVTARGVDTLPEGGFLLLEAESAAALLDFSARFKDLNDTIEVVPVVELGDGVAITQLAYGWVDSVS